MERLMIKNIFKNQLVQFICLLAIVLVAINANGQAFAQSRVVVLPFYSEQGNDVREGGRATQHYRRIIRFINNQLVRHNFEVINGFAADASEREYNRVMERAREDSAMACLEMCKRYSADAAYIVWLNVKTKTTDEGLIKASARLDGEGYDSAGRDLGIGLSKTFIKTKTDRDDAIAEVEKEVGDLVGRKLTAWSGKSGSNTDVISTRPSAPPARPAPPVDAPAPGPVPEEGGILKKSADALENIIDIRIDGATEYEALEVFQKVLNTATGVTKAKRYSTFMKPDNPQACHATWSVTIEDTDPFRLQANIMTMIKQILDAGGDITLKGVPYRYTAAEVNLLMGLRPGDTTSREIQFVYDRERMKDKEMEGRHDPYESNRSGFE